MLRWDTWVMTWPRWPSALTPQGSWAIHSPSALLQKWKRTWRLQLSKGLWPSHSPRAVPSVQLCVRAALTPRESISIGLASIILKTWKKAPLRLSYCRFNCDRRLLRVHDMPSPGPERHSPIPHAGLADTTLGGHGCALWLREADSPRLQSQSRGTKPCLTPDSTTIPWAIRARRSNSSSAPVWARVWRCICRQ